MSYDSSVGKGPGVEDKHGRNVIKGNLTMTRQSKMQWSKFPALKCLSVDFTQQGMWQIVSPS